MSFEISEVLYPAIGFLLGSILSYFMQLKFYRWQKNYDQRMKIYDEIYYDLYQLKKSLRNMGTCEINQIKVLIEKGSLFKVPKIRKKINELNKIYDSFMVDISYFSYRIGEKIPDYVPNKGDFIEEIDTYSCVPYPVPFEIMWGFFDKDLKIIRGNLIKYLQKSKRMYFDETIGLESFIEGVPSFAPSKKEIVNFCKIFKSKELIKDSEPIEVNYKKLLRLLDTSLQQVQNNFKTNLIYK